jgi:hypothetical protein
MIAHVTDCHKLPFYSKVLPEFGNTTYPNTFHLPKGNIPEYHTLAAAVFPRPLVTAARPEKRCSDA